MSMDPLAPPPAAPTTRAQLAAENEALKAKLAELEERLTQPPMTSADAAPTSREAWVCKTKVRHSGVSYGIGDLMPFDPEDPPAGCGGLIEGVHYERARVLIASH